MPLKLKYRVLDEKGKVIYEQEGKSWTKQMLQILVALFKFAVTTDQVRDITNTLRTMSFSGTGFASAPTYNVSGPAGNVNYGIILGTGTNSNSPTDYVLQTPIAHGNSAGQLSYGVTSTTEPVVAGTDIFIIVSRTFSNGSGSTITVNEMAMYSYNYLMFGNQAWYFCIARDKLASGVDILNGASRTFQYVITESNT